MARAGHQPPEPPQDGCDEPDLDADLLGSALSDALDVAQESGVELQEILRDLAPDAPAEDVLARAARIEVDRRIVARCAKEGFKGPNTNKLLVVAFEYATPVVGSLMASGKIFRAVARLGRPVKRQPADEEWTWDDRAFLTERCVDLGVFHTFHEYGLKQQRWDPRGGATLTTYAANACILGFATVYPKWWRGRVLEAGFGDLVDLPERLQVDRREPDVAQRAVDRVEAERLLRQMPAQVSAALWMRAVQDMTQAEVAQMYAVSEKALEGRIGRARARLGLTRQSSGAQPISEPADSDLEAQEGDSDR